VIVPGAGRSQNEIAAAHAQLLAFDHSEAAVAIQHEAAGRRRVPVHRRAFAGIVERVGGKQGVGDVGLAVQARVREDQRAALAFLDRHGFRRNAQLRLDIRPAPAEGSRLVARLPQLDVRTLLPKLHEM